jgi:hypothetical protein
MTYKFSPNIRATKTYHFTSAKEENTLIVSEKKQFTALLRTKIGELPLSLFKRCVVKWRYRHRESQFLNHIRINSSHFTPSTHPKENVWVVGNT